ncbi:MAG: hypothetical protein JWQ72_3320 [Polaromonas sp.]|nr:hypothetical protein [Polaromonas sp.]
MSASPTPGPGPAGARTLPIKRLLLVLAVVATAYAAVLLLWGQGPKPSLALLWSWTGLQAAGLCLLNYLLRGFRWRLWMAQYGRHFKGLDGLRLYLAGYAFTPTPGNVGEALRGLMLARQPLTAGQSLGIFGAERLADLCCLLLLCLPAVGWLAASEPLRAMLQAWPGMGTGLAIAALLVLAVTAGLLWRYRQALLRRLPWLRDAGRCLAVRPWAWFGLTLAAWLAQGLAVWLFCSRMGLTLPPLAATGLYAAAMVAGALSALPAGLGGTEAVLTGLLVAAGAVPAIAVAITILVRVVTLWLAVAIGVLALLYSAAIRKDISFR